MIELKANKEIVLQKYNKCDKAGKELLESIFPESLGISAHEKLFLEACKDQKKDPVKLLPYAKSEDKQQEHVNAIIALETIISYVNKGKIFDYKNGNEYKWFPRFDMNPSGGSGFAFSIADADCAYTHTHVGPRLSYISEALCIETVKICMPYYKAMLIQ